jgi:hypothetical protein
VECRIGVVQEAGRRLIGLAGRLSIAQVPELLSACEGAESLHLDLQYLVSADVSGIEALQRLRDRGAVLEGAPGYLQMKLDSPAPGTQATPPARTRPRRVR